MRNGTLAGGAYVFSDLERLSEAQTQLLDGLWQQLAQAGPAVRLLNHPRRCLRRFDLLRRLHECGSNRFNVYRPSDPARPWHYPVFLRHAREHSGSLSPCLKGLDALWRRLVELILAGLNPDDLLVVEFCDTASPDGLFRKYAAFRVGDRIVPRHVLFSRQWMVKEGTGFIEPGLLEERLAYLRTNPHERELRAIFDLAGIDYGRIDYSLVDGAIQI